MAQLPRMLRRIARPAAELTAAVIGLLCCVATSDDAGPPDEPPDDPIIDPIDDDSQPELNADLLLHNASEIDQVVRIRQLEPAVDLDCDAIADRPGELLDAALFAPAETWTLPTQTNLPLVAHSPGERGCWAVWIEADALAPAIAFWRDGTPIQQWWPATGMPGGEGTIVLSEEESGAERLDDRGFGWLHQPVKIPPQEEACAPADDGLRVAWSAPVPTGVFTLEMLEAGLDGCLSLTLVGDVPEQPPAWFVCVAADAFPFEVGDAIQIDNLYATGVEGVHMRDAELGTRELVVARGSGAPALLDLQWTSEPLPDCDVGPEPACGTVSRAAQLRVSSLTFGAGVVRGGAPALELFAEDGRHVRIESAVVQERVALDPECAFGPDVLGLDLELAVTIEQE